MNLTEAWDQDLLNREQKPSQFNRASSMGINCIRRLYFERVHSDQKKPFDLETLQRMNEGTIQEANVRGYYTNKPGWDVTQSQIDFGAGSKFPTEPFIGLQLSGHWEGFLHVPNEEKILMEIKTTNEFKFPRLNSIDDFYDGKWWERYLDQVTVYMKAAQVDRIRFIVKDRSAWRIKEFDYEFEEKRWKNIMVKCELINGLMEDESIPHDALCWNFLECDMGDGCPFYDFCCPNKVTIHEGFMRVNDQEEVDKALEYMRVRDEKSRVTREHDKLKAYFKRKYEGVDGMFFGMEVQATGKYVKVAAHPVAESTSWRQTWKKL